MADEIVTETDETTDTPPVETPPVETKPVETKPVETKPEVRGWRDFITKEDLKPHAERFQTVDDLVTANLTARQKLSRAIVKPGKDATDEEKTAYRRALGVPEKIEDYKVDRPETIAKEIFESEPVANRLKAIAEIAHKNDVSTAAFKDMVNWYFKEVASEAAAINNADKKFAEESTQTLKSEWGAQYDAEVAFAQKGAEWAFGEKLEDFRSLKAGENLVADHPVLLRALSKIGRAVSEDTMPMIPVDTEAAQGLRAEMEKLTAEQDQAMQRGETEKAKRLDDQIMKLATRISGDGPIVGSGRAI